jgi:8-oxo-dGTP pyrophosphatase MutT (NUDIX family)
MSNKNKYCSNCGKYGHSNKKCTDPITSLGIICFKYDKCLNINHNIVNEFLKKKHLKIDDFNFKHINNLSKLNFFKDKIKFLLIKRKHSLNYIEFIRGRYDKNNLKKLVNMFELMSPDELENIRNNNLNTLWNNLWKKTSTYKIYQKELKKSENNFNYLKNNNILEKLLEINPTYNSPEWGFPKGRRNNFEKNFDCAKREFYEETNMKEDNHIILRNLYCLNENYMGTNKLNYRHIYYISIANSNVKTNNFSNNEIGEVGWFNWEDSINIIRPYYNQKIELLNKIFLFAVNSFEDITIDSIKKLSI